MHPFEAYLRRHHLEALTVSVVAQVCSATVWRAARGYPIKPQNAQKIRQAVVSQTGLPYTGPLALTEPELIDQFPTLPIKKIPRRHLI